MNKETEEKIVEALLKQDAMEPQRIELGGGVYYRCHWLACHADVHRYQNYCEQCGQKIDWSGK